MARSKFSFSKEDSLEPLAPNWFLLIFLAITPLQSLYLRLGSLGAGINLLNLLLLFAFLTWRSRKEFTIPTATSCNVPLILFGLSYCFGLVMRLSTLGSIDFYVIQRLKDTLMPLLVFFIVLNTVRDKEGILKVLIATWLPLPLMFVQFARQFADVGTWHYSNKLRNVVSTFEGLGSNEIAAFFAAYGVFCLVFAFIIDSVKIRVTLFVLAAMNAYCVMFSYSRGSWLAFVAGLALGGWYMNRKIAITVIPIAFVFGGALLPFLPVSVQERVTTIFVDDESERDNSAESRFVLWGIAWEEFKKSPIVGRGYRTFVEANPWRKDTHGYYMKLLAEFGLVGFSIFMILFWRTFKAARYLSVSSQDPLFRALGTAMVGCIGVFAIGNIFGDRMSHYPLAMYFWSYLALILRAIKLEEESPAAVQQAPAKQKFSLQTARRKDVQPSRPISPQPGR
jgi:O-antigen ligase